MRFLIILVIFILGFILVGPSSASSTSRIVQQNIVGYITGWSLDRISLADIKLEQLTHLIYSHIQVTSENDPTLDSIEGWEYIRNCVKAGHDKGVKVLVSFYGSPSGELSAVVKSDTLRPKLVNNIKDLLLTFDLDGIDIDWEEGQPQADTDKLITDLYSSLHPLKKMITIAASWYRFDISLPVSNFVDLIDVMTYDMWSPNPFPFNSLFNDSINAMNMWVKSGYPKEKLNMGIPFYGKDAKNNVARYSDIINDLNVNPDQNEADVSSILAWDGIVRKVVGGVIWWNGIDLVKQKVAWVMANGLGGVMCFEVGSDKLNDARSLLRNIYAAFNPPMVFTYPPSGVTMSEATIKGNLTDKLGTASNNYVGFEYGLTPDYGITIDNPPLGTSNNGDFMAKLTNLTHDTVYHYRAKVSGDDVIYGEDQTFITASEPWWCKALDWIKNMINGPIGITP